MRRLVLLATVFSSGVLGCDQAKPEGPPVKTEAVEPSKADPVAAFDATKVCDRQATLLAAQMAQIPDARQPPKGWREPYVSACAAAMKTRLESDQAGTLAYAQCLDAAESSFSFSECQANWELSRREAELARQTRAPVPSGAEVCRVEAPTVRAAAERPTPPELAISSKAICVNGSPVVAMIDGAIDPAAVAKHQVLAVGLPLHATILERQLDPLKPKVFTSSGIYEPVLIAIDKRTRFDVVVDVVYTAQREGASEVWYAARTEAGGEGYLPLMPPNFADPALGKILVQESGFTIRTSEGEETVLALADATLPISDPGRWDLAGLEAKLTAVAAESDDDAFSLGAESSIPFAVIAKVIDALRGPDCPVVGEPSTWPAERCRFPRVVLDAAAG